jgi:hypothetical protein
MTIAFYEKRARRSLRAATLVLVDVCRTRVAQEGTPAALATRPILARCQQALAAARNAGVPVVFVHDAREERGRLLGTESRWLAGFEPRRYESVVASSGPSCYASPYFLEILDGAGRAMLLAGLLGLHGATATAADALRYGHRLTLLSDAIDFDGANLIRASHAPGQPTPDEKDAQERHAIEAITTAAWLAEITSASPPARADGWQATTLLYRHARTLG